MSMAPKPPAHGNHLASSELQARHNSCPKQAVSRCETARLTVRNGPSGKPTWRIRHAGTAEVGLGSIVAGMAGIHAPLCGLRLPIGRRHCMGQTITNLSPAPSALAIHGSLRQGTLPKARTLPLVASAAISAKGRSAIGMRKAGCRRAHGAKASTGTCITGRKPAQT